MKHILKEWKQTLHQMRLEHPELLLFKIHKVFQMFIALQSENVETLIKEMLLLFTDVHKTGPELVITIQVSIGLHTCIIYLQVGCYIIGTFAYLHMTSTSIMAKAKYKFTMQEQYYNQLRHTLVFF